MFTRIFLCLLSLACSTLLRAGTFCVQADAAAAADPQWLACDAAFLPAETDLSRAEKRGRQFAVLTFTGQPRDLPAVRAQAEAALARGFRGFLVTATADFSGPARAAYGEDPWLALLSGLRERHPEAAVILRSDREVRPEVAALVQGYLVEEAVTLPKSDTAEKPGAPWQSQVAAFCSAAKAQGKEIFYRAYAAEAESADVAVQAAAAFADHAVAGPAGTHRLLAPISEVPRVVLCLYGFPAGDPTRAPVWPPDTFSAQMLQMALEWLGYEMEFHDVGKGRPPARLDPRICGIICDSRLELPFEDEEFYSSWLTDHVARGLKVLFAGAYPGDRPETRRAVFSALGIRGSGDEIPVAGEARFTAFDKGLVDAALVPRPRTNGLVSALAPGSGKVRLGVAVKDRTGIELRCDAVYTAPWGGALLDPYLFFRTSAEDVRLLIDPFAYLSAIWPAHQFPVPDHTTLTGTRLFLSHIDGDGFTTLTRTKFNTTCAEIVRDQFLQKYPLPVTVSVIESDVCALLKDLNPADRPRYEEIARSIFALPNVQAASHAWSHPFVWIPEDTESVRSYPRLGLEFAIPALNPGFSLEREIAGSVKYISTLLPAEKKMEMFLWSGNCRPSGAALRMVRELGLEAMNGGNTMIHSRAEGVSAISSKDTFMDGELQVYAPVQNEYVYTGGFTGPLYGGFRSVITTFERTGTPRRLKPVNVYYHFYSVQTPDALRALTEVHDWCMKEELRAITARDFVRLARDTRQTRIYAAGKDRWIAVNEGHCRTFRLPAARGLPVTGGESGVLGYNAAPLKEHYIHTDGRAAVRLELTREASPGVRLVSSSGRVSFSDLTPERVSGVVNSLRENRLVLAGWAGGTKLKLRILDAETARPDVIVQVDSAGTARITLPPVTGFSLEPVPAS